MCDKNTKAYIDAQGTTCLNPKCNSVDFDAESVQVDCGSSFQEITCNECGSEWTDLYELTAVSSVKLK